MPGDEYARDILKNAFFAPIEGPCQPTQVPNVGCSSKSREPRRHPVPVDLSSQTFNTGWNIGIHDFTCI